MKDLQYYRQKLYFKWALILCIVALTGYTVYFILERYINSIGIFSDNLSIYFRLILIAYFCILLFFLDKFPKGILNKLGFLIAVPLGWTISVISFLTIGYEGITVT